MYGVVLWSDTEENKAVIWCEDHGDLAFYCRKGEVSAPALDPGDFVQFDLTMERHLRFAHNPRLVSEGIYADLADALSSQEPGSVPPNPPREARQSADVIPFRARVRELKNRAVRATAIRA